VNLHKYQ